MKKLLVVTLLLAVTVAMMSAQGRGNYRNQQGFVLHDGDARPVFGTKFEREIDFAEIDNKSYEMVTVKIKVPVSYPGKVKMIVRYTTRGGIYHKKFKKCYLYAFPDGSLKIGNGNALTVMTLTKTPDGTWQMLVKEKGIY